DALPIFGAKIIDPILFRPFFRRLLAHLHQAALAGGAELLRVETAFTPDHRLHQHRIEMMLGGDRPDERVVLLKTCGTDPLHESVERIARAPREPGQARRRGEESANDQLKDESDHNVKSMINPMHPARDQLNSDNASAA